MNNIEMDIKSNFIHALIILYGINSAIYKIS